MMTTATNDIWKDPQARRARNTVSTHTLYDTDEDTKKAYYIEAIKDKAIDRGVLEYAEKEIERCETIKQLRELRDDIQAYWPPSESQLKYADWLCDELGLDYQPVDFNHGMSWYKKFIDRAQAKWNEMPVTDEQKDTIEGMHWCIDIPEPTVEEMQNRGTVQAYIKKHKFAYKAWKKTRLDPQQIKDIQNLKWKVEKAEVTDNWCMMFDKKTADAYIEELSWELQNIENKRVDAELDEIFNQPLINEDNENRCRRERERYR